MSLSLIQSMIDKYGYPVLNEETLDDFVQRHEHVVLFFTENPRFFPESNDVAVILPELMKLFDGQLSAGVIDQSSERILYKRFGFKGWPSLVFLRRGEYLGVITGVQDWADYVQEFERLLASEPVRPPSIGIPVVVDRS